MIALVDCNNFYASCERLFNPKLIGVPIIVASNNDGCVIARSNETKLLGIKMGDPIHQIKDIIKKHNVKVYSSNYTLYGDMSDRVMNTLSQYCSDCEIYSIDECFLDFSYQMNINDSYIRTMREDVIRSTGIPVSIGLASTKTLAKMANKLAKKYHGYLILDSEEKIQKALIDYPVEDIWGIGRQYTAKLKTFGITTALQLRNMDEEWAYKNLTVEGLRLVKELKGYRCRDLELTPTRKQGICTSRQFGKPTKSLSEIKEALSTYVTRLGEKLRQEKSCCNVLTVSVTTNVFNYNIEYYAASKAICLGVPCNNTPELIKYAMMALELIFKPGVLYNKVGVVATGLIPSNQVQTNLFDYNCDRDNTNKLMKVVDKINNTMARNTVMLASNGYQKNWNTKREFLSPAYTTNWKDIITAKL